MTQQTDWDLHETPQSIIPLEFTEEINPESFGLEVTKAVEMTSGLSTTIAEREILKNAYLDIIDLPINKETIPIFKELRLKISKNRTQGIEKWHKANKAFYLAGGRFVDAVKNKEIIINEEMEAKLLAGEKYFENLEKEQKAELNKKRIEIIRPYVDDVLGLDFSDFSDENFDDFVLGKKTRFEANIEAEKQEAIRVENERLAKEIEDQAIRIENARLQKEAEAKEIELQKERAEAKAKQDAIELKAKQEREKAEAERKIEADKQAKIQAENERLKKEIQDKKDAEIKSENERLTKIALDAKAPIKEQMNAWVDTFTAEIPEQFKNDVLANEILTKFWGFKSWAKKEIEK